MAKSGAAKSGAERVKDHVRAAIRELESALSEPVIKANIDVVVCIAEGRLRSALEITKEALAGLEDVL